MKKINLSTMLLCIFFTSYRFYCSDSSPSKELLSPIHMLETAIVKNRQKAVDDILQENPSLVHRRLPNLDRLPLELAIMIRSNKALDALLAHNAPVTTIDPVSGDNLLHCGAHYGSRHAVKALVAKGLSVDAKNNAGQNPVHLALRADGIHELAHQDVIADPDVIIDPEVIVDPRAAELVGFLLQSDPSTIDTQDDYGATPLHYAALHNKVDVVKELMKRGPNVFLGDMHDNFALGYAISNDNAELAQLILAAGNPYDVIISAENILDLLNNSGRVSQNDLNKLLFRATRDKGFSHIVAFLLKKGADVNAKDKDKNTPLYYAAAAGDVAVIQLLIGARAFVNLKGQIESTPLHWAIILEDADDIQAFIDPYAAVNEESRIIRITPPDRRVAAIQVLLDADADVTAKDQLGRTPLHWAVFLGAAAAVQVLIDAHADVKAKDQLGRTPLHWAAGCFHCAAAVQVLIDAHADVHEKDQFGRTPLHCAAGCFGDAVVVQVLTNARADVHAKDGIARTPLHWAAIQGNVAAIKALIDAGAFVNEIERRRRTPLHFAAKQGDAAAVQALIDADADIKAKEQVGDTPLHWAARQGNNPAIQVLIKAGADVNAESHSCEVTPLHCAIRGGHAATVQILIDAGAFVDVKDQDGKTPLDEAVARRNAAIIQALKKVGAPMGKNDQYNKKNPANSCVVQ